MKYKIQGRILRLEEPPSLHIDVECKDLVEPILEYKFPSKSWRSKTEVNFLFENFQILNIKNMPNYDCQKIVLKGKDKKLVQVLFISDSNKLQENQIISGVITKYDNNDMPVFSALIVDDEFYYSTSL